MNLFAIYLTKKRIKSSISPINVIFISFILLLLLSSPGYADSISSHGQKSKIFPGLMANDSTPLELNITVNTTDYTVEAAENQNKQRINYILSSMLDPSKGNMNLSDIMVVPYSVSRINSTGTSLEKIYGNKTVYRVTSIIHVNTTPKERTKVFRATMPKLLNDETLMKASYSASYERT